MEDHRGIVFCDLVADDGWEPVDLGAVADGPVWRSTKVDASFNAFGVRYGPGVGLAPCQHNLRQLVIVFGGEVTVSWGDGGAEGSERFELGGFWVTDPGTVSQLTAGPDGAVVVESWSAPVAELITTWHGR